MFAGAGGGTDFNDGTITQRATGLEDGGTGLAVQNVNFELAISANPLQPQRP